VISRHRRVVCSKVEITHGLWTPAAVGRTKLRSRRLAETNVRYWHFSDIPPALTNVRYRR